jgi:hypothetical protein
MTIRQAAPRQRVYILRFWETRSLPPDAPVTWRFSAQDPQTGERRGFADLDGLMAFLAAQTGEHTIARHGGSFPRPGPADARPIAPDRGPGQDQVSQDLPLPVHPPALAPLRRTPASWTADSAERNASAAIAAEL